MAYITTLNQCWAICRNGCDPNEFAHKRPTRPQSMDDRDAVMDGDGSMFWSDWNVVQWCPRCGGLASWTEVWLHELWTATGDRFEMQP